jgi:hypothetical protein
MTIQKELKLEIYLKRGWRVIKEEGEESEEKEEDQS